MRGQTALAIVLLCFAEAGSPTMAGQGAAATGGRDEAVLNQAAAAIQLIVQFRAGTNAADPALLSRLTAAAGAPVAYLRPLSGGVHLLRVSAPSGALHEIVRRLKSRPEVVDVQPDVSMRPQS